MTREEIKQLFYLLRDAPQRPNNFWRKAFDFYNEHMKDTASMENPSHYGEVLYFLLVQFAHPKEKA